MTDAPYHGVFPYLVSPLDDDGRVMAARRKPRRGRQHAQPKVR